VVTIAEHDRRLKAAGLPTVATLTARILRVWNRATQSDIEAGARWYSEAQELASTLTGRPYSGGILNLEQTASIIAALSPRTSWSRNVAGAVALVIEGPTAARRVGCMTRNVETAQRAKTEGFAALNGPKTSRFARNIAGDRESVTVDVWAARVADIDPDLLSRVGVYDAVERAYQNAARRVGVDPATMQATTRIVARNGRSS
jgi:hypothetical protein